MKKYTNGMCCDIVIPKREIIMCGHEYDRQTKFIYETCNLKPIGKVINGKIKWLKK